MKDYESYRKKLFGIAYRKTGQRELAEDLTQDTLIKAATTTYQPEPSKEEEWICRILRNQMRDERRKDSVRVECVPLEGADEIPDRPSMDIVELPETDYDIYVLLHEGYTFAEIGEKVGECGEIIKSRIGKRRRRINRSKDSKSEK